MNQINQIKEIKMIKIKDKSCKLDKGEKVDKS